MQANSLKVDCVETVIRKMPESQKREIICSSQSVSLTDNIHRVASSLTKEPAGDSSLHNPQHKNRAARRKHHSTNIGCLTYLHKATHPCTLSGVPFSIKLVSLPGWWATSPDEQKMCPQMYPHHIS